MKIDADVEKLIDIINDYFGCDAAYYDVNPLDLATHLIENGVKVCFYEENDMNEVIIQEPTWDDVPDDIKDLVEMGLFTEEEVIQMVPKIAVRKLNNTTRNKKRVIDVEEWCLWYTELTSGLEQYDHYDTGYRDAVDRIDDWMDAQPIIDVDSGLVGQYRWERDVAISQLEELGIGFAQKIDGVYLSRKEYEKLLEYKHMYEDLCN